MSAAKPRVVIVDDKDSMRRMLETVLSLDYHVTTFGDPAAALRALEDQPADVLVTDFRMPGMDGLELLARAREASPDTQVIVMTAYGTVEQAVEAMKRGAFDYIPKPFEADEMAVVIGRALEHLRLKRRARTLEREVRETRGTGELVGDSAAMQRVRDLIARAAPQDVTVLVTGPTGTGKELVARALHAASPRAKRPFVVVHCAALPKDLLESELFGHSKGAFSGAQAARRGMVEEARGGTLFLDDVNYLDLELQAKVNRLVAEGEVRPVGADGWRKADVRIIAAANIDLEAAANEGRFREDLYYRLNVVQIPLPPLDQRKDDIPALADHFVTKHRRRLGRPEAQLTDDAVAALTSRPWPGNIRELENTIERALILAEKTSINADHLQLTPTGSQAESSSLQSPASSLLPYADAMDTAQAAAAHTYLTHLLTHTHGNVSEAARIAGMARQSLHRLLKQHDIDAASFRGP